MRVIDKFYSHGTERYEDRVGIPKLDRLDYMTPQYVEMHYSQLCDIKLDGDTALLYVGGVGVHSAECRRVNEEFVSSVPIMDSGLTIKNIQAYMLHKYAGILSRNNDITYASINSNTCASSLYTIYEAEKLLGTGEVDNVIIIAEEKTSNDTIRIFSEHDIPLTVGEGFACVVLDNNDTGVQITKSKWKYSYNRNPFLVDDNGYRLVKSECDVVKGHKTGTKVNDEAEYAAFGNTIGYKHIIGHCQGASGLIEVCMVIDDKNLDGDILCVASGLGGFYGSCVVTK